MGLIVEQVLIYGGIALLCIAIVLIYVRKQKNESIETEIKVATAKEEGLFEPVSLHPHIDLNRCIGSAACVADCPEKDILGIVNGKATVINTSNCVGHGACFHACPVEAISLRIGTELRGVDLPHVNENFETNISGIYIAGELGGMGLIKNSVEQGQQAIESIIKVKKEPVAGAYDVVIIGAGPAGISASLAATKRGLNCVTFEQDSLGGTVSTFPRAKIVMTAPMDLPLYGKVKLYDTSKDELLKIWNSAISEYDLDIRENTKIDKVIPISEDCFKVVTNKGEEFKTCNVVIAIGRRGSPRKLNIPGEDLPNVAYRLLEPERISNKKIVVVGGGDSAIESALLLKDSNKVTLSYRKEQFSRLKPKNRSKILDADKDGSISILYNSNLRSINERSVIIDGPHNEGLQPQDNDLVYIFAGGELPTKFLEHAGVQITKRFGYTMKKHK